MFSDEIKTDWYQDKTRVQSPRSLDVSHEGRISGDSKGNGYIVLEAEIYIYLWFKHRII